MAMIVFVLPLLLVSLGAFVQADFRTDALNEHNKWRKVHHSPPLVLDASLNNQAQIYAEELAAVGKGLVHSNHSTRPDQGENLAAGYYFFGGYTIVTAVDNFYYEGTQYNYSKPGFSEATGHFTQLVWKSSVSLGVGQAYNAKSQYHNYQVFRYSPPGNYADQFAANVLPA